MLHSLPGLQMWCTQCNVAFSWRTGAVVTNGVIHNPHYFEWVRRQRGAVPRTPGDLPCGGLPTMYQVEPLLRRKLPHDQRARPRDLLRTMLHMAEVDLPSLRRESRTGPETNVDLRLDYLLHRIDREEWRRKLQQREKRRERAFAVMQVYDMFVAAASDIFRAILEAWSRDDDERAQAQLRELYALQDFTNDSLTAIGNRFNMSVKLITQRV